MERLGKNIAAELEKIANRVISERKIESITRIDRRAISYCVEWIEQRFSEQNDFEWPRALMITAIIKFHPIQRLTEDFESNRINEIFAITIITDFLNPKLEKDSSRNQSGIFLREIFRYFTTGNSEPHAIFCMIRCMNQLV